MEEVYRGRSNLLFEVDREASPEGINTALNAHIDTVPPHIPPSRSGDLLFGRGTADDKGNVAAIVGALQVLAELERRGVVRLKNKLTAMFVIDEETGGNGSLALAMDRELKARYDSILVLECTGNRLHPANRGAVFIKCEGRLADAARPRPGPRPPCWKRLRSPSWRCWTRARRSARRAITRCSRIAPCRRVQASWGRSACIPPRSAAR